MRQWSKPTEYVNENGFHHERFDVIELLFLLGITIVLDNHNISLIASLQNYILFLYTIAFSLLMDIVQIEVDYVLLVDMDELFGVLDLLLYFFQAILLSYLVFVELSIKTNLVSWKNHVFLQVAFYLLLSLLAIRTIFAIKTIFAIWSILFPLVLMKLIEILRVQFAIFLHLYQVLLSYILAYNIFYFIS